MAFDIIIENSHGLRTLQRTFARRQFQTKGVITKINANLAAGQQLDHNSQDMGV